MNRRNKDASARFAERRRREDDAPRLCASVPELETLKLILAERRSEAAHAEVSHVRPIVVAHAPAMFALPCGNPACRDGGYDLTTPIMTALARHQQRIEGDDTCRGHIGRAECARVLHFTVTASYRQRPV